MSLIYQAWCTTNMPMPEKTETLKNLQHFARSDRDQVYSELRNQLPDLLLLGRQCLSATLQLQKHLLQHLSRVWASTPASKCFGISAIPAAQVFGQTRNLF